MQIAIVWLAVAAGADYLRGAEPPQRKHVVESLRKATDFFHATIAAHGGYAWTASLDGKLRHGEGPAGPGTIWVQPPGTPAVGLAFLNAYSATGDEVHLAAAFDAALALVKGQLRSGGWYYRVEFDPAMRKEFIYRDSDLASQRVTTPAPGGWDIWRQRRYPGDMTMLDDDTTPSALRFLMRVDKVFKFQNQALHEAVEYGLASTLSAQYPIGAWSHNYDRFSTQPPDEVHYPILAASYPSQWSRTWTKDFTACYMLNDRITQNMIATMLDAYRIYEDNRYLASAQRGGKFLALAQMPDPQPAWAQGYNRQMQPVWDRKFEPPAITALESQDVLATLLLLYRETADPDYLKPVERALNYLGQCSRVEGKLARFYELQTNRPLYFTKDYRLTYDAGEVPTHYAFTVPVRLQAIEAEYRRLLDPKTGEPPAAEPLTDELSASVAKILAAQDTRGAWPEPGTVRDAQGRKIAPPEGVVHSQTFIDNINLLARYLQARQ